MIEADPSLGGFLRRCRHGAGLTQGELAERAQLSVEAINTLERGTRRQARPETLRRIATALGLSESERDYLFALVRSGAPTAPLAHRADVPPNASTHVRRQARAPIPPTTFIGREQELAVIRAAVEDASVRLPTLIGPGGIGKTRLAFRVAEQVGAAFADGVFFVSLATVTDPTLVTWAIARAVGATEYGTEPLRVTLASALHDRRALLVLDNLEHLLESAPDIAALAQACPRITILVTSRVVLNLAAERVIPIRPLSLTTQCTASPSPGFLHSDAIDFFTQRARESVPEFSLTNRNAPAVMELCSRLDCLPLALELAAARLRVLPLPALVARLDRKLDVLRGGPVDVPARHQDLRGAIAWSFELLDADVQRNFAQLSVFTGGFTLDAAEAVCRSDAALVLDAVAALMNNSLLFHDGGDEWRYFTLETIRDYANERMEMSGEAGILRRNLALYLARLGEEADVELTGPQQARWLDAIEAEHDNFRSALRWVIDVGSTLPISWARR